MVLRDTPRMHRRGRDTICGLPGQKVFEGFLAWVPCLEDTWDPPAVVHLLGDIEVKLARSVDTWEDEREKINRGCRGLITYTCEMETITARHTLDPGWHSFKTSADSLLGVREGRRAVWYMYKRMGWRMP